MGNLEQRIALNTLEVQASQLPRHTITLEDYKRLGGFPVTAEDGFKYDHHDVTGGDIPALRPSAQYNYASRKRGPVHYVQPETATEPQQPEEPTPES